MSTQNLQRPNFKVRLLKSPSQTNSIMLPKTEQEPSLNDKITLIPPVAKFVGFEINKLNIVRIKMQNKTTNPVRIHVLPFNNQFFQTKINKRGMLLPRSTDDLFIYFRPTQYIKYEDQARINIDSEIYTFPILAYPVIDRDNINDFFPRLINFGKVYISEKEIQRIPIRCKVPLNFDFKFTCLEPNDCINIYPMKGTIPANSYIDIEVWFIPQKKEEKTRMDDRDMKHLKEEKQFKMFQDSKDEKAINENNEKNQKEEREEEDFIAKYSLWTSQIDFEVIKIVVKGQGIKVGRNLIYNKNTSTASEKDGFKENVLSSLKDKRLEESRISLDDKHSFERQKISLLDTQKINKEKPSMLLNASKGQMLTDQSQIHNPMTASYRSEEDEKSFGQNSQMLFSRTLMPKNYNELSEDRQQLIKKISTVFKKKGDLSTELAEDKKHDGTKIFKIAMKALVHADANSRQQFEKIFIDKFSNISSQDEKKSLKFFSCIGDRNITKLEVNQVREQRVEFLNKKRNELEQKGIKRFDLEINKDAPIIEQIVPNFDCKWDLSKNDKEKRKNIVLKRLLSYVAKLILMTRLKDNCDSISELLRSIRENFNKQQRTQEIEKAKKYLQENGRILNETYLTQKNKCLVELEVTKNQPTRDATVEQKELDLKNNILAMDQTYSESIKAAKDKFESKEEDIKKTDYYGIKKHNDPEKLEFARKLVIEDWQKVEYTTSNKKTGGKANFQFEFEEHNIARTFYPIQYESYNTFSSFKYEVNPRTGFDDYAPIEIISQCDSEVMQYRNWEIPPLVHYPPIEEQRVYRTGAEEEYSKRGCIGTHDKIEDKKEKTLPKTLTYKLDIPQYSLLLPHKTIRPYERLIPISELDSEYYLNPSPFILQDEFDPNESDIPLDSSRSTQASLNYLNEVQEHDYLSKIPGLNSSHITKHLQVELSHYYKTKLQLPSDCGFIKDIDNKQSVFKGQPDYEDHLSDDEYPDKGEGQKKNQKDQIMSKEEEEELKRQKQRDSLKKMISSVNVFSKFLEDEDEDLMKLRQVHLEEIFDEYEDTQANVSIGIKAEKYKWVATMPSKNNEYNRFIYNNNSKLYI